MTTGHVWRRRAGGWTLIEIVAVVLLFSTVAGVAGEVFVTTTTISRDADRLRTRMARFDGITRKLRADAWSADAIEVNNGAVAILRQPSGERVAWTIGTDGSLTRTAENDESARWDGVGVAMRFASDDVSLIVGITGGEGRAGDRIVLVSQVAMSRRASR